MYRPSKDEPKGRWARHLHERRRLDNLSQMQAFELVQERMGWSRKSRASYVAIDMGTRQPRPEETTILAEEFGWPPDPEIDNDLEDPTLAAALNAMAAELAAIRAERAAWQHGVVAVLRAYADGQVPAALLDALAPQLPVGAPRGQE